MTLHDQMVEWLRTVNNIDATQMTSKEIYEIINSSYPGGVVQFVHDGSDDYEV